MTVIQANPATPASPATQSPAVPAAPSAAPTAAPKISWIKHLGNVLAKIGSIFVKESTVAEPELAKVAEALLPQFAPEIAMADGLFTKIAKQIVVTQGAAQLVSAAPAGEEKLKAVVDAVNAEASIWMANLFPGSKEVSKAATSGLVQAVYDAIEEQIEPSAVVPPAPAA